MSDTDPIIELETRLTHLDDIVEQLSDIIIKQQDTIGRLERTLKKLVQEHAEIKDHIAPEVTDTPPPHY